MKYFNDQALRFLQQLACNNNKEWFNNHKDLYKKEVEAPFKAFVADLIDGLQPYVPDLHVAAKDCIFRIYKDVRFSKDKTPYKVHVSAMISAGGRKNKTIPGAYVQLSAQDVRLYSGTFVLTPRQCEQIRQAIYQNPDEFNDLVTDKDFVSTFSEVRGEKYKRVPALYDALAANQPLLLNKTFYYFKKYQPALMLNPALLDTLLADYLKAVPLNNFLRTALAEK